MDIISKNQEIFNQAGKTPPDNLSTLDLIEHMLNHHHDEALSLVELALWHQQQAEALSAERRALSADVVEVLRQAEGLLR